MDLSAEDCWFEFGFVRQFFGLYVWYSCEIEYVVDIVLACCKVFDLGTMYGSASVCRLHKVFSKLISGPRVNKKPDVA